MFCCRSERELAVAARRIEIQRASWRSLTPSVSSLILCAKSLRHPLTANPASLIASWRAFPAATALGPVQTVTDRIWLLVPRIFLIAMSLLNPSIELKVWVVQSPKVYRI
jgi:hypothetical protein